MGADKNGKQSATYDVIVVGAGISGLFSAHQLKQTKCDVLVLEARDRVGGRSWTLRGNSPNEYADMGGAYFGRRQTKIIELAKELGLKFYNLPVAGKTVFKFKDKTRYFEGDTPPTSNPFCLMDLAATIRSMDFLSLQIPLDAPWLYSDADRLDAMSVIDYIESVCWTSFAKTCIFVGFAAVFASPLKNISMLYALHLVRSCGGVKALFSQRDGLQEMKLIGGSCSISERLVSEIGNKRVRLNSCVTEINQLTDGVLLVTKNGEEFKAKAVIVATSPSVLRAIEWVPALPLSHDKFVRLTQEGHYFKTIAYYEKPYWTDAGLKGDLVSDEGIIKVAFPDTKYDGSYPAIMGFVDGKEYEEMSDEQRKQSIANHYADLFGIEAMRHPIRYIEKHWVDEAERQFSGPCVFSLPPRFLSNHRRFWGQPFGRVVFGGSESSMVFRGYMEGGIRSAQEAVQQALRLINRSPTMTHQVKVKQGQPDDIPYSELTFIERCVPGVGQFIASAIVLFLAFFAAMIV